MTQRRLFSSLLMMLGALAPGCGEAPGSAPAQFAARIGPGDIPAPAQIVFEAADYAAYNPDVAAFCRFDGGAASSVCMAEHFRTDGRREGRRASRGFDVKLYLSLHHDLAVAFGTDYAAAVNHFETFGYGEERMGSLCDGRLMNPYFYRENHPDLQQLSFFALCDHWERYGIAEGRWAAPGFHVTFYKAAHADLTPLANAAAVKHYGVHGQKEKRTASFCSAPLYDAAFYRGAHPDLDTAARQGDRPADLLCLHWERHGMTEGRIASTTFSLPHYKATNPDLTSLSNKDAAFHYVQYGQREGRRPVP